MWTHDPDFEVTMYCSSSLLMLGAELAITNFIILALTQPGLGEKKSTNSGRVRLIIHCIIDAVEYF
jgi:hypothetical protein